MYRGTTPTLPIRVKGVDLTGAKIFLTLQGPNFKQITFTTPDDFTMEYDGTDTVGEITLTQKQTFSLGAAVHEAQIRWVTPEGFSGATVKKPVTVEDVLLKEVIKYE